MRYYTQSGGSPELKAAFFISGPQAEDQVEENIRKLLDQPGIHMVAVFYNHGVGERVDFVRKIPEEKKDG